MVVVVDHGRCPGSSSRTWRAPGSTSEICSGVVPTTRPSMMTAAPDGRDSTRSDAGLGARARGGRRPAARAADAGQLEGHRRPRRPRVDGDAPRLGDVAVLDDPHGVRADAQAADRERRAAAPGPVDQHPGLARRRADDELAGRRAAAPGGRAASRARRRRRFGWPVRCRRGSARRRGWPAPGAARRHGPRSPAACPGPRSAASASRRRRSPTSCRSRRPGHAARRARRCDARPGSRRRRRRPGRGRASTPARRAAACASRVRRRHWRGRRVAGVVSERPEQHRRGLSLGLGCGIDAQRRIDGDRLVEAVSGGSSGGSGAGGRRDDVRR